MIRVRVCSDGLNLGDEAGKYSLERLSDLKALVDMAKATTLYNRLVGDVSEQVITVTRRPIIVIVQVDGEDRYWIDEDNDWEINDSVRDLFY